MTQPTQPGPQKPPRDVMEDILERAGIEDINEVPVGSTFSWGKQGVWKAEEPVPLVGYQMLNIFALFQSESEVRVYAVQKAPDPQGNVFPPHRFTLSKTSPAYFIEVIRSKELFVDEIAKELLMTIEYAGDEDDEDWDDEEEEEEGDEPNGAGGGVIPNPPSATS